MIVGIITIGCSQHVPIDQEIDDTKEKNMDESKMDETNEVKKVVIKESQKKQAIDGFGASGAWWSQVIGGWSEINRNRIMDLLFDQEKGIGLSIYRYNIGAGSGNNIIDPWRRTYSIETSPGVYNVDNDKNAIWVLQEARKRGIDQFIAFANSPPARMTKSNQVTGARDGSSNLNEDMYEAYADYLIDIVMELRSIDIPVGYISPINEPQWDWSGVKGQEGCHYTTDECLKMVQILNKKINDYGIDLEISAIEAGEWKDAIIYADKLLTDDSLNQSLNHFAGHSYWSDASHKERFIEYFIRDYPNKKLWVSEWTEMVNGRDYGMDSAMVMANVIHDDLTILSANSWQYWIAVSKYNYRDGLIYTNEYTEDIIETKRLYGFGNYSKYIRPGYFRTQVVYENPELKVSSYIHPEENELVMVVINNTDRAVKSHIQMERMYAHSKIIVTDDNHNLEEVYNGEVQNKHSFLPKSITTIVYQRD